MYFDIVSERFRKVFDIQNFKNIIINADFKEFSFSTLDL